ncbi:MAG TPA: hypothetical protein VMT18_04835, partial [Planctomycetota bacterium]|nr:hypothetical protein [Planctomycetota bacterium]
MKLRAMLQIGGVAVFLASATAPFVVDLESPFASTHLSEQLLDVRGTMESLAGNALQARLGLLGSYDGLAATQSRLRQQISRLESSIQRLPPRSAAALDETFGPFAAGVRAKDGDIASFPAENAQL